jgi:methylated-DNA-protein-cysteine methyltransferase-like protein
MLRVVRPGFHARVYAAVRRVPRGRVTTYGAIAGLLGSARVARHVGWALAALPGGNRAVPWHRVVNRSGAISSGGEPGRPTRQRALLEQEGVSFDERGRVDLARHQWPSERRQPHRRPASR